MARFLDVARDSNGNAIGEPTVTVYDAGTSTLASIFSDVGLTTPQANPFTGATDGSYSFYASSSTYRIVVAKAGYDTFDADHIDVGVNGVSLLVGTLAMRPAAGITGRLYYVTDAATPHLSIDNGAAWQECAINGIYTADGPSPPIEIFASGSTDIQGTSEGARRALMHLLATKTDDIDIVGLLVDHVQRTNAGAGTIKRSGIHVRTYTQPDNGGDVSGLLIASSGGGNCATFYKTSHLRPAGYDDHSTSPQPALEVGTSDAGPAIIASAGSSAWGASLRNHAIEARLGTAAGANQSDGIVIWPTNNVFDSRLALVVGSPQSNAAPINQRFALLCSGSFVISQAGSRYDASAAGGKLTNDENNGSASALGFKKGRAGGAAAANEILGDLYWNLVNSTPQEIQAAMIRATAPDTTAGSEDVDLSFFLCGGGALAQRARLLSTGSLVLGGASAAGTAATNALAIGSGTAPTSSPADMIQLYSADAAAGDAELRARDEAGRVERITGLCRVTTGVFSKSDITLANVTGLSFNVEAGARYRFRAELHYDATAAGGYRVAIGGTCTATSILYQAQLVNNATAAWTLSRQVALGGAATGTGPTGGTIEIFGSILVNAAGTLTVQWAQSVASGSSTIAAGSTFTIQSAS